MKDENNGANDRIRWTESVMRMDGKKDTKKAKDKE